jgi:hypothetical protein
MCDGSCRTDDQGELTVSDASKAYHGCDCRTKSRNRICERERAAIRGDIYDPGVVTPLAGRCNGPTKSARRVHSFSWSGNAAAQLACGRGGISARGQICLCLGSGPNMPRPPHADALQKSLRLAVDDLPGVPFLQRPANDSSAGRSVTAPFGQMRRRQLAGQPRKHKAADRHMPLPRPRICLGPSETVRSLPDHLASRAGFHLPAQKMAVFHMLSPSVGPPAVLFVHGVVAVITFCARLVGRQPKIKESVLQDSGCCLKGPIACEIIHRLSRSTKRR